MKLTIKFIMGLIVATGLGLVPVQLDASSPTPLTDRENAILEEALNETFAQAQAAEQTAQPAQQRYRVPVRVQSTIQRLLTTLHQQGRLPLNVDILDACCFLSVLDQYLTGYFVGAFEGRHLDNLLHGFMFFVACWNVLRLTYIITAFTYNHAVHGRMLPALIAHAQQPQILTIPRDAEIVRADCSICFAPLLDEPTVPPVGQQPIIATNCNAATGDAHLFHTDCLRSWFDQHGDCPICRAPIIDPAIVEVVETAAAAAPRAHAHAD